MKQAKEHQSTQSVLGGKESIRGLPRKKKSPTEEASTKRAAADCESVLDGPACIQGVQKRKRT